MKNTLHVYLGNRQRYDVVNPTCAQLAKAVKELNPTKNNFLILDYGKPNPDSFVYIQAATLKQPVRGNKFQVELRFEDKGYPDFEQYRVFINDAELLLALFVAANSGFIPSTTRWENITKEIRDKARRLV